ncbi:MAG: multimeric flavodoxin WrbA [Lentisphaeria bacterium]|jgi:multimeric flavodoxin WrbA
MRNLLISAHTPSPNTLTLSEALREGVYDDGYSGVIDDLNIVYKSHFDTTPDDIRRCDGLILLTTENFGYMSGALKDLFDRCYYPLLDTKRGLPYCLVIRGGQDGTGAKRSAESIISGLGWKASQEPLILKGAFDSAFCLQIREYGQTFSLGLAAGIY